MSPGWNRDESLRRLDPLLVVLGIEVLGMAAAQIHADRLLLPLARQLAGEIGSVGLLQDRLWVGTIRILQLVALAALLRPGLHPRDPDSRGDRTLRGDLLTVAGTVVAIGLGVVLVIPVCRRLGVDPRLFLGTAPPGFERPAVWMTLAIVQCGIGPAAEEAVFRGCLHRVLRVGLPATLAIPAGAAIFAAAHVPMTGLSGALLVPVAGGLLFAVLYEARRRLAVPIAVHIAANGILLAAAA